MQFSWLSPEEARVFLEHAPMMAENHGDRIAADRRAFGIPKGVRCSPEEWAVLNDSHRRVRKGNA